MTPCPPAPRAPSPPARAPRPALVRQNRRRFPPRGERWARSTRGPRRVLVRERRPLAGGLRPGEGPRGRGWRRVGAGLEAPGTEAGVTFCLHELPNGVVGGSNRGTLKTRRRWVPRAPGREFGPLQAAASVWRPGPRFVGTQAISVLAKLTAPVRGRGTIRCKEKWGRNS